MKISLSAARNIHLAAQGLLISPKHLPEKVDVLQMIQRMGALQIDTINVVARSPYLVLWSRLGHYANSWLDELLVEKKLFEYWSHEACFLPIENFGRYRHQMLSPKDMGWKFNATWLSENATHVKQVLKHIKDFGECRSADFERKEGKSGGWWEWKPEKRSLEVLFTTGKVMVARRDKFQRVYDLTQRVHPVWDDQRDLQPRIIDQRDQILDAVRALGITRSSWVNDYFRMKNLAPSIHPEALFQQERLRKIEIKEWDESAYYHPDHQSLVELAIDGKLRATHTCLLSPFDPIVWDRKRTLQLFDFDYRLECYTPEEKRRYGYFTLPILRRGKLIGRMDAKAHRKNQLFEIKSIHLESNTAISEALCKDIINTIISFANWHSTPKVQINSCENKSLMTRLKRAFS